MNATRISPDAILGVTSGLMNENSTMVLSFLHPAIRPLNQLRMLEDSSVVYSLVRAPSRLAFYVETGGLPVGKAQQFVANQMNMYKNKVNYNQSDGTLSDQRKFMTMQENYWLPTRDGAGTKIETLPEGTQLNELTEHMSYFLNKLYKALKVPITRTDPGGTFNMGRPTEITRDELKFTKFVHRLRHQFSHLFYAALEKQLVLRQVIAPEEWDEIKQDIKFIFTNDNYFEELKNSEILRDRAATTTQLVPFIDQFISRRFVFRNVWQMTDEKIEEMMMEIQEDLKTFGPMVPPEAQMQESIAVIGRKLPEIINNKENNSDEEPLNE